MKVKFMSLSSGSSGNCYYLEAGRKAILIDAGIPVRTIQKNLKENGLSFDKIMGLLITHDHTDHIRSAGSIGEIYHILSMPPGLCMAEWNATTVCRRN